jgi:hypothetical protein
MAPIPPNARQIKKLQLKLEFFYLVRVNACESVAVGEQLLEHPQRKKSNHDHRTDCDEICDE